MNYIIMFVSLILLVSCEHHDMHVQQTEPSVVQNNSMYQQVFKYDNSSQCRGGAIAVEIMGQELIDAGIDVICSQKDRINASRSTVCDGSTGVINAYQINTSNVDDALTLGFTAVSNITDHRSKLCRPIDQPLDLSTVKIYKYDGSLQCDASGIGTETLAGSSLTAVLATQPEIMA